MANVSAPLGVRAIQRRKLSKMCQCQCELKIGILSNQPGRCGERLDRSPMLSSTHSPNPGRLTQYVHAHVRIHSHSLCSFPGTFHPLSGRSPPSKVTEQSNLSVLLPISSFLLLLSCTNLYTLSSKPHLTYSITHILSCPASRRRPPSSPAPSGLMHRPSHGRPPSMPPAV